MSVAKQLINESLSTATFCVNAYLQDLSDEDLLRRPCDGGNHIAWQLGHLLASDNRLINSVCPGSMPDLPSGFADQHSKENAGVDVASSFLTKQKYLELMVTQHQALRDALSTMTDEALQQESPEGIREYAPSVGSIFNLTPSHWMMHSGQWVIVRRQLGKEALF